MKFNALMHVSVFCENMDAMFGFYEKVLGCPAKMVIRNYAYADKTESPYYKAAQADPNGICIVYFEVGSGQYIECIAAGKGLKQKENWKEYLGISHLALTVDDIFKMKDELEQKGVVIDSPPRIGNSATWQMWIHDPEDNPIEIMQYTENSFQLTGHIDEEKITVGEENENFFKL